MDYPDLLNNLTAVKSGQIIAIDGPAGSGKTTLAGQLQRDLNNVLVIHMDDLYMGWQDAFSARLTASTINNILRPINTSLDFKYDLYDWRKNLFTKSEVIKSNQIFIIEGVSSGQSQFRPYISKLIWLDVSDEIGLTRVLARDGIEIKEQMLRFQLAQREHFASELTENAADYRYEGVPKTLLS
jgi:uridine kinase